MRSGEQMNYFEIGLWIGFLLLIINFVVAGYRFLIYLKKFDTIHSKQLKGYQPKGNGKKLKNPPRSKK